MRGSHGSSAVAPSGCAASLLPGYCTVRVTVVVWVMPPPVAVMVMVRVPLVARELTVTVMVEVPAPGAAMEDGLKETVLEEPWPLALSVMAELKPPAVVVVMVDLPEEPLVTVMAVGEALTAKDGVVPVTVRLIVVVCVTPPPVPVTVMA